MLLIFAILFRQPYNFILKDGTKNHFEQKLDHFDSHSDAKFDQYYYTYQTHPGTDPQSLVFYLESEDVPDLDFSYSAIQYAQQTNSTLFSLEHRFFGSSFPKNQNYSLTKDSLFQYLTTSQVLNDIACFINKMKLAFNCQECTISLFGGGYLGAIASWFHVKYPHLSTNVISSSSPIVLQQTLPSYDEKIYQLINNYNSSCSKQISSILQTSTSDPNLIYVLSESVSNSVLYHSYTPKLINAICTHLTDSTIDSLTKAVEYSNSELDDTLQSLDFNSYKNTSINSEYRDYRSWTWLRCTELGLWHTSSTDSKSRIRPNIISEDFFKEVCFDLFDRGMTILDPTIYGNENLIGTNTIFINADNDPMNSFSFINDNDTMVQRFSFNVPNGFRFEDLRETDSQESIQARNDAFDQLNRWSHDELNPADCEHGVRVFGSCVCNEHYGGDRCQHKMHPEKSFKIVTILSVAVPTLLLLIIGAGVWFCGKREDNEIGARPTLYT